VHHDANANVTAGNIPATPSAFDDLDQFRVQIASVVLSVDANAIHNVRTRLFPIQHTTP
jgi:hypothetical protein